MTPKEERAYNMKYLGIRIFPPGITYFSWRDRKFSINEGNGPANIHVNFRSGYLYLFMKIPFTSYQVRIMRFSDKIQIVTRFKTWEFSC